MSAQKETLFLSFFLILFIAILHSKALSLSLYWTIPWLDLLMHFLGGFWITITSLWFMFFLKFSFPIKKTRKNIWIAGLVVIVVAIVAWEIFEIFAVRTIDEPNFVTDTISDTIMGLLGFIVAYRYFIFSHLKIK